MASVTLTRAALAAVAELASRYDAEKVIVIDRHNLIGSWHGVTLCGRGGRGYRAVHSSGRVEHVGGLSAPDWQHELDELEAGDAGGYVPSASELAHDAAAAVADDAAAAALIVDALEALPADPRDALLELHGTLVTLPGYREGDRPLLDSIITRLERRFMANRGEPGALAASQHASRRV